MYTLYHAPEHGSVIVSLVLNAANIPHKLSSVDRLAGELDSIEIRKLNPTGRLPILETPQGPISEAATILMWLGDKHGLVPTVDDRNRAVLITWLMYLATQALPDLHMMIYPSSFVPDGQEEATQEILSDRMKAHFKCINKVVGRYGWLADPNGIFSPILCMMMRWSALFPLDTPRWFFAQDYELLHDLALQMEASPHGKRTLQQFGMESTAFSAPIALCLNVPAEGLPLPEIEPIAFIPPQSDERVRNGQLAL